MQSDYKQNWTNRQNKIATGEGGVLVLHEVISAVVSMKSWGSTDV